MLGKMMLKDNKLRIHIVVIFFAIIAIGIILLFNYIQKINNVKILTDVNITTTLDEEIKSDTYWCGGFNIAWQNFVKQHMNNDLSFENLNQSAKDLSLYYYPETDITDIYTFSGIKSLELKNKLESDIYEKYEDVCEVSNNINWYNSKKDGENNKYLIYSRLNKNLEFEYEFTELGKSKFFGKNKTINNVKYFGINENTSDMVYSKVQVLYYNSETDYAIKLVTKSLDEIILCVTEMDTSLGDIYQNILTSAEIYLGNKSFLKSDTLKVPYISFNRKINYDKIENVNFINKDNEKSIITDAWQTIEFNLNASAHTQKEENDISYDSANIKNINEELNSRDFSFDKTFAIFLKENNKSMPYFAAYIEDISKFEIKKP